PRQLRKIHPPPNSLLNPKQQQTKNIAVAVVVVDAIGAKLLPAKPPALLPVRRHSPASLNHLLNLLRYFRRALSTAAPSRASLWSKFPTPVLLLSRAAPVTRVLHRVFRSSRCSFAACSRVRPPNSMNLPMPPLVPVFSCSLTTT